MQYQQDTYTKHYIVEALFRLIDENEYDKITVSDIARKAGVGRATFYRYFKSKEDVFTYYFNKTAGEFRSSQRYFPRCKQDHIDIATTVFDMFKKNKDAFKLLKKARLEGFYLNYLNDMLSKSFSDSGIDNPYQPYIYAGMLFNVSMAWLETDCATDSAELANLIIDSIYFKD